MAAINEQCHVLRLGELLKVWPVLVARLDEAARERAAGRGGPPAASVFPGVPVRLECVDQSRLMREVVALWCANVSEVVGSFPAGGDDGVRSKCMWLESWLPDLVDAPFLADMRFELGGHVNRAYRLLGDVAPFRLRDARAHLLARLDVEP